MSHSPDPAWGGHSQDVDAGAQLAVAGGDVLAPPARRGARLWRHTLSGERDRARISHSRERGHLQIGATLERLPFPSAPGGRSHSAGRKGAPRVRPPALTVSDSRA
jgi:hypothetical protein